MNKKFIGSAGHLAGAGAAHERGELPGDGGAGEGLEQLQALALAVLPNHLLPRHCHEILQLPVHLLSAYMRTPFVIFSRVLW